MVNCPKCGKQADTGDTGNYYFCEYCKGMGDLEEDRRRFEDEDWR